MLKLQLELLWCLNPSRNDLCIECSIQLNQNKTKCFAQTETVNYIVEAQFNPIHHS